MCGRSSSDDEDDRIDIRGMGKYWHLPIALSLTSGQILPGTPLSGKATD